MKRTFLLLICFLALVGCRKSTDTNVKATMDVDMTFSVFNSDGQDLLDSSTPNHIDTANIKLYYQINGEVKEVFNPRYTYSKNVRIYKHPDGFRLVAFLNTDADADSTITYIKWNDSRTDTIQATFKRVDKDWLKRKVYLNGELIWDWTSNKMSLYKITM